MGWSELGDGCYDGDGPADATGEAMDTIAQESRERTAALPSNAMVLRALVAALQLDGSQAPFYVGPKHVESMTVHRGTRSVRIDACGAEPWLVAELFGMLEVIAEEYQEVWKRPPYLAELVHYLRLYFESEELVPEHLADTRPWKIQPAAFAFGKRKPNDRADPPAGPPMPRSRLRVKHPKFGVGEVVEEHGDRLTIDFRDDRRVLLRKFVEPI